MSLRASVNCDVGHSDRTFLRFKVLNSRAEVMVFLNKGGEGKRGGVRRGGKSLCHCNKALKSQKTFLKKMREKACLSPRSGSYPPGPGSCRLFQGGFSRMLDTGPAERHLKLRMCPSALLSLQACCWTV